VSGVNLCNIRYRRHYLGYAEIIIVVVVGNYVQTRRGPISGAAVRPGPWTRKCNEENGRVPFA